MPTTPVTPYVPQYITVHLGAPSAAAENVTVSFPEYVKNVFPKLLVFCIFIINIIC